MACLSPENPVLTGGGATIAQAGTAGVCRWARPRVRWYIQNGTGQTVYVGLNRTDVSTTNWDYKIVLAGTLTSTYPVNCVSILVAAGVDNFVFSGAGQNSAVKGWAE